MIALLFKAPEDRPMSRREFASLKRRYWLYTIAWIAALILNFVLPIPEMIKWGLAFVLAILAPIGGQLETFEEYERWFTERIVFPGKER